MFKFIKAVLIIIITILCFISCPGHTESAVPVENFALDLTVENKMDVPITVKIRNYFKVGRDGAWWGGDAWVVFSEWSSETVTNFEIKPISNRTTENFVITDPNFNIGNDIISSFEIIVETQGGAVYLAGYETEDPLYDATGLCYLIFHNTPGVTGSTLFTKEQIVRFEVDYILPVKLVINADRSVSFIEELVKNGKGIYISKPVN